jgi:hypothetical protein
VVPPMSVFKTGALNPLGRIRECAADLVGENPRRCFSQTSDVRDHDLPEMPPALEMAVGRLGLGKGECPIDHRA